MSAWLSGSPGPSWLSWLPAAIAVALLALCLWRAATALRGNPATLYTDEGRDARVFASPAHRLRAKPDRLTRASDGIVLHEFKSRSGGVWPSDRAQVAATALALRGAGVAVVRAQVQTGDGRVHEVALPSSDAALHARVADELAAARLAVRGIAPAPRPSVPKCRACAYRHACPHAAKMPAG